MARTYTAAAFIKNHMPIGYRLNTLLGQGGALSDQDAVDKAEYFTHQPRPDFAAKVRDWPNGGKPKDARFRLAPQVLKKRRRAQDRTDRARRTGGDGGRRMIEAGNR
jgi:cytochrome c